MDGGLFQNECKRRVISASALHNRLENLEAKIREFEIPLEPFDSDFVVSTPASDSVDSLHDAQVFHSVCSAVELFLNYCSVF